MEFETELDKYEHLYGADCMLGSYYGMREGSKNWLIAQEYIDSIPRGSHATFLDVSCGRGETLQMALAAGLVPHGTETVPELCESPSHPYPMVRAVLPDLPFADGSFDYVLNIDVLEHCEPENLLHCLHAIARVARKQAHVVIDSKPASRPDPDNGHRRIHLHISRFPRNYWLKAACMVGRSLNCAVRYRAIRGYKHRLWFDRTQPYEPGWEQQKWLDDEQLNYFWYDKRFPINQLPHFDAEPNRYSNENIDFEAFKADIKKNGLRQPVLVHKWYDPQRKQPQAGYWTRDGNHRVKAMYQLGFETIPAIVYGMHLSDGIDWKRPPMTMAEVNDQLIVEGRVELDEKGLPRMAGVRRPEDEFGYVTEADD